MPEQIGKYRVLERVGRGGMGTVYRAHDPVLNRTVALKVISSDVDVTDELRARFFREAQACAQLNHPNVVTVHDMGEQDGLLYIVMEFLEGHELKELIARRAPLSLAEKLSLMVQVCDGLAYAHDKGIVHRDIKPGNVFVTRGGPKIVDFGIARVAADQDLTRTGLIMGTLRYMAPEQARGQADHRSDQYAVGAVFYELLSNRPAFETDDTMELLEQIRSVDPPLLSELDPAIPGDLSEIIARALSKDPAERFADLGEMRDALAVVRARLAEDATQAVVPEGTWPQVDRRRVPRTPTASRTPPAGRGATAAREAAPVPARRWPVVPVAIGAACLVAVAAGGALYVKMRDRAATAPGPAAVAAGAQARTAAEEARTRLGIARDEAARADAERLAGKAFAAAVQVEREGHTAFAAADFAGAQVRYRDAIRAYEEATGQARRGAALAREEAEARRVQRAAGDAQRSAEAAGAPRLARAQWDKATGVLRLAEDALRRQQYDQGQALFADAAKAFREAEMAALGERAAAAAAAETAQRREAQAAGQAAMAAASARQDAERADAGRFAERVFTDAQQREREAKALLDRREFAAAEKKYREAQQQFAAAAQEGKRAADAERARQMEAERQRGAEAERQRQAEAERRRQAEAERERQVALQKQQSELEPVREAVAAARRTAEQIGAERLAAERFGAAREREREATAAIGRQDYVVATQALLRAEAAYKAATQEAIAARRRQTAGSAPAPAVDPRSQIRAVLNAFEVGVQTKDLTLLQRLGVPAEELRRLQAALEQARTYKVELRVEAIDVDGDGAVARGVRQDVMVSTAGKGSVRDRAFSFKLKRSGPGWIIESYAEGEGR